MADRSRALLLSLLAAVSGMLAAAWVVSAMTTVEAGSAQAAVLGPWLALLLGAVLLLVVPWAIHPRGDDARRVDEHALPLTASRAESWVGEASSSAFLVVGVVLGACSLALAALLPVARGPWIPIVVAAVLIVAALVVVALARIRVLVDAEGLRVRGVLVPLPLRSIPLERILAVEALVVEPLDWGGWGYRGLPGRFAIVLRRGPGIVVTTRRGRAVRRHRRRRARGRLDPRRSRRAGARMTSRRDRRRPAP